MTRNSLFASHHPGAMRHPSSGRRGCRDSTHLTIFPPVRLVGAAAMVTALCGCGYAGDDEIQVETAAIQERVPVGTPVAELLAAMRELGFTCVPERQQFTDAQGSVRETEQHFSCTREQSRWLVCTRRTRAILVQLDGKLSNVLVNVGHFCS